MFFRHLHLVTAAFFALTIPSIVALGFFDISLSHDTADDYNCCQSGSCNCEIVLRVCLLPHDFSGDDTNFRFSESCTFGFGQTLIDPKAGPFSGISRSGHFDPILSIPFTFTWPGSTTVSVHVYLRHNDGREETVQKAIQAIELNASTPGWTEFRTDKTVSLVSFLSSRFRVRVRCGDTWYGPFCNVNCEPQDGIHGHFQCDENGKRQCLPGWRNPANRCREAICAPGCRNGTCDVPGECKCAHGWKGPECNICVPRSGCVHGYCEAPFECICHERWGGPTCNNDADYCHHKQPCRNGAICIPHDWNNYTCECPPGFTGRDCEIEVNPCWNNPCQNFGTCVVKSEFDYVCACGIFHTGRNCERLLAGNGPVDPCHVNGQYYDHGQKWEMTGCRQCQCIDGSANCTKAMCQTGDCFLPGNPCPDNQHCSPVTPEPWTCLRGPCPARTYGRCISNDFDESAAAKRQALCGQAQSKHCDQFILVLNTSVLPVGSYVGDICYHLLVFVFERRFAQYHANCTAGHATGGIVRVKVVSLKDQWPAADFRKVLQEASVQNRGAFSSPLLQSVTAIDNVQTAVDGAQLNGTESSTWTDSGNRIIIASIVVVGVLICILALVAYFLYRRMRTPRFRKSLPPADMEKLPPVNVHLNNWTFPQKQCNILAAACGVAAPKQVNYKVRQCSWSSPGEEQKSRPNDSYPDVIADAPGKPVSHHVVYEGGSESERSVGDVTNCKSKTKPTMVTLEASV